MKIKRCNYSDLVRWCTPRLKPSIQISSHWMPYFSLGLSSYKRFHKLVTFVVVITFLWSGLGLADYKLAPSSNLSALYSDLIAFDTLERLGSTDMGDLKVFYESEIEGKLGRGERCFGIRGISGGWAFYVINLGENKVTRYLSNADVRDRFFSNLERIESIEFIGETSRGARSFRITGNNRPFIEACLSRIPAYHKPLDILDSSNSILWKFLNSGKAEEIKKARGIMRERLNSLGDLDKKIKGQLRGLRDEGKIELTPISHQNRTIVRTNKTDCTTADRICRRMPKVGEIRGLSDEQIESMSIFLYGSYLWHAGGDQPNDIDVLVIVPDSDIGYRVEFSNNIECVIKGERNFNNVWKRNLYIDSLVKSFFVSEKPCFINDKSITREDMLGAVEFIFNKVQIQWLMWQGWPGEENDEVGIRKLWLRTFSSLLYFYIFSETFGNDRLREDLNAIIFKYLGCPLDVFYRKFFLGELGVLPWDEKDIESKMDGFIGELEKFLSKCRQDVSTLKAPTAEALEQGVNCDFGYIRQVIRKAEERRLPKWLISKLVARGPPFSDLVWALRSGKIRLFVLESPLFGIPRHKGAVLARDTVPSYVKHDKQGNLCIYITSNFYDSLRKDEDLFTFVIDHDFYEKGAIPYKTHRKAWQDRGWQTCFIDRKSGINKFLKLYIDRLAEEGDILGLDRFKPSKEKHERLVYKYARLKREELLRRDKVFLTINNVNANIQGRNDRWRANNSALSNGINLNIYSGKFENEEIYVYLNNPDYVRGKDCILSFSDPNSNYEIIRLLFAAGLLEDCGARSVTCIVPKNTLRWLVLVLRQFANVRLVNKGDLGDYVYRENEEGEIAKHVRGVASPLRHEQEKCARRRLEHALFMPDTEMFRPREMAKHETLKRGDHCLLAYSTNPAHSLVKLFSVLADLERRGVTVTLFMPHFSYMRQHKTYRLKKHGKRAISGNSVRTILKAISRFTQDIYTINVHFSKMIGYMDVDSEFPGIGDLVRINNINLFPEIAEYFMIRKRLRRPLIIGADKGASNFCKDAGVQTGIEYGGHMNKERDPSKPVHLQVRMVMPEIDVIGRDVILLDDIISSGTTIINAALLLKSRGANRVLVGCVYGEFTKGIDIFDNPGMREAQIRQLLNLGQLTKKQAKGLRKGRIIDDIVSTNIMPNKTSRVDIKDTIRKLVSPRAGESGAKSMGGRGAAVDYEDLKEGFVSGYEVSCKIADSKLQIIEETGALAGLINIAFQMLNSLSMSLSVLEAEHNRGSTIKIRVNSKLGVNSCRYYNPATNEVEIIFSEIFARELLSVCEEQNIVAWILAERLFHELGHDNEQGTPEEEKEEEKRQILRDVALYLMQVVNHSDMERFFTTYKPKFRSGYYFRDLIARVASGYTESDIPNILSGKITKEKDDLINDFLNNAYKKWAVNTIEDMFSKIKYMGENTLFSLFLAQTPVTSGWFGKAKEEGRWDEILGHVADSSFLDKWYLEKMAADGKISIDNEGLQRLVKIVEDKRAVTRARKSEDLGWVKREMPELADKNLVYLSPEAKLLGGLKSLVAGGLGVLAGELLVGFGDIGINTYGVSLLYKNALIQEIDDKGNQKIHEESVDYSVLPVAPVMNGDGRCLTVNIDIGNGKPVKAKVWELREGQARVFLLDTDLPCNSSKNRAITKALYGGNKERERIRLKQNVILGRGALLIFEKLGLPIGFLHLNEAHTVVSAYDLQKKRDNPLFRDTKVIFTTHTPVEFGLPKFDLKFQGMIDRNTNIVRIYFHRGDKLDLAHAALKMADVINAVSQEHRDVTVRRWAHEYRDSLIGITNGVDAPYWREPLTLPSPQRGEGKKEAKRELLNEVAKRTGVSLSEDALTIVISRRITKYKCTTMLLADLDRLANIINASGKPVQIIFGGNSHPSDRDGQAMIKRIVEITKDERFKGRIVFVPNYNIEFAKLAVRGADVWLSTPFPEEEACATSYAKALVNGTIVISTFTGGPMEHMEGVPLDFDLGKGDVGRASGFFIKPYNTDVLYQCIEKARDIYFEHPEIWQKMMENAAKSRVDIRDVSKDYARRAYFVSLFKKAEIFGMSPGPKEEIVVYREGDGIASASPRNDREGEDPEITVQVKLDGVKPENVKVELHYGLAGARPWKDVEMELDRTAKGVYLYKVKIPISELQAGRYDFTTRVLLVDHHGKGLAIKWYSKPGDDGIIVVKEKDEPPQPVAGVTLAKRGWYPLIGEDYGKRSDKPVIYELCARFLGKKFSEITDREIKAWAEKYNYIWMMGVWEESDFSRRLNQHYDEKREASSYAIPDYKINPNLGGEEEFRDFVKRCNKCGLKVMLDFVPNHMSADSPWINEHPDWFIQGDDNAHVPSDPIKDRASPYYRYRRPDGASGPVIHHGQDPYHDRWGDTAQLNLTNKDLRARLVNTLKMIARITNGGGARCDMVNLTLREHIKGYWFSGMNQQEFDRLMPQEFWTEAIAEVKKEFPDFIFAAEAYWAKEEYLQGLGFSCTYDQHLYEQLKAGNISEVKRYLANSPKGYLGRSLHFLANHDVGSAKGAFGEREQAAAVLIATLPGELLIPGGQEEGFREHLRADWIRYINGETPCAEIRDFYVNLLKMAKDPIFREGDFELIDIGKADVIAFVRKHNDRNVLVIINYSGQFVNCPVSGFSDLVLTDYVSPGTDVKDAWVEPWGFGIYELSQEKDIFDAEVVFNILNAWDPQGAPVRLRWEEEIDPVSLMITIRHFLSIEGIDEGDKERYIMKLFLAIICSTLKINENSAIKLLNDIILDDSNDDSIKRHSQQFGNNYDNSGDTFRAIMVLIEDIESKVFGDSVKFLEIVKRRCQFLIQSKGRVNFMGEIERQRYEDLDFMDLPTIRLDQEHSPYRFVVDETNRGADLTAEEAIADFFVELVNEALREGWEIANRSGAPRETARILKKLIGGRTKMKKSVVLKIAKAKCLKTNSSFSSDKTGKEVEIIFAWEFVLDLIRNYMQFPVWTDMILFQRLCHEIGHFRRYGEGTLIFYDTLLIELYMLFGIQENINIAFEEIARSGRNLNFRSGYYYYLLYVLTFIEDYEERKAAIRKYPYFGRKQKGTVLKIAKKISSAFSYHTNVKRYKTFINDLPEIFRIKANNRTRIFIDTLLAHTIRYLYGLIRNEPLFDYNFRKELKKIEEKLGKGDKGRLKDILLRAGVPPLPSGGEESGGGVAGGKSGENHPLTKKGLTAGELLKRKGGLLREGLLSGRLTALQFAQEVIRILDRKKLFIPSDIAQPDNEYRLGYLFLKDMAEGNSPTTNLRVRRLENDLALLSRAVSDQKVRDKFAEAIRAFLDMPGIGEWSSYEAVEVSFAIIRIAAEEDPDRKVKEDARRIAFEILDRAVSLTSASADPLQMATRISAIGNSLDFADPIARQKMQADEDYLLKIFKSDLEKEDFWKRNDMSDFKNVIDGSGKNIVYVFDNAGEDVLDFVLINELLKRGYTVTLAGKSLPAGNDTTANDLRELIEDPSIKSLLGENIKRLRIAATGTMAPGTDLARVSLEFNSAWQKADLIIFKGQGNYYTVRDYNPSKDCFFVLKVKFPPEVRDKYRGGDYVAEYVRASGPVLSAERQVSSQVVDSGVLYEVTFDENGEIVKTDCTGPLGESLAPSKLGEIEAMVSQLGGYTFALDIDNTVTMEINKPITAEICEYLLRLAKLGKGFCFVSGKSIEEIVEYGSLYLLIDLFMNRRIPLSNIVVYTSNGAGRFTFNENGEPVIDSSYNLIFTNIEREALKNAIAEVKDRLEKTHGLKSQGITPFERNHGNIGYNYSPYGRDKKQYGFETEPAVIYSYIPRRLTRREIAELIMDKLRNGSITSLRYEIMGDAITIGFVKAQATKKRAIEDILRNVDNVIFVGDEVLDGIDRIAAEMSNTEPRLRVVSVDEREVQSKETIIWIGGKVKGTVRLLRETARSIIEKFIIEAQDELVKEYGPGILSGIKKAEIVDRDGPVGSQVDGKITADIDIFRNKDLVLEVWEHEALHEILGLIIPEKPDLAEVVATWYSAKRFARLLTEKQGAIIALLKDKSNGLDPSGKHAEFLEGIKAKGLQGVDAVIAYLGVAGISVEEVMETDRNLREVIKLFNDFSQAGNGHTEGKRERRTFRTISDKVRKLTGFIVRNNKWVLPETGDAGKARFIVVDKDRKKGVLKIEEELLKFNIRVVTEVPKDGEFVVLVDPSDVGNWQGRNWQGQTLPYLPLPYMEVSLKVAGSMLLAGRNEAINKFVKGFYEILLGRNLQGDELEKLFTEPWWILPEVEKLSKDLDILNEAIEILNESA